jgi:hypothetical protein
MRARRFKNLYRSGAYIRNVEHQQSEQYGAYLHGFYCTVCDIIRTMRSFTVPLLSFPRIVSGNPFFFVFLFFSFPLILSAENIIPTCWETTSSTVIHNLAGESFTLEQLTGRNGENGYLIRDERGTIEEAGFGVSPHAAYRANTEKIARLCAGKNRILSEPELLYPGPTFILYRYRMSVEGRPIGTITVDPVKLVVVDALLRRPKKTVQARTGRTGSSCTRIAGIPCISYYLNDMPTALAMIFTYWEKKGFPDMRIANEKTKRKETDAELVYEINKACESCLEASATELFAASRGYRFVTKTISSTGPDFLPLLQKELSAGRPVLVQIASCGLVHYGVLTGLDDTASSGYGELLLPAKEQSTGAVSVNLLTGFCVFTCTLITPSVPEPTRKKN